MDTNDIEKFRTNYMWFSQFFSDLNQLLIAISRRLVSELDLQSSPKNWYYDKLLHQPTMPSYYVKALGNKACVVQIYAILDTMLLEEQPAFKNEPSLILVKHSRADKVLWLDDYGLRVIRNKQITQIQTNEKVIGGEFRAGGGKGAKYFAFQTTLDHFAAGNGLDAAIQTEIIDVLSGLPDWEMK